MKKWNKATAAVLAGAMALSLAACGGGGGTSETKAGGAAGDSGLQQADRH